MTLTELVVVILIIVTLVLAAVPAFYYLRNKSHVGEVKEKNSLFCGTFFYTSFNKGIDLVF